MQTPISYNQVIDLYRSKSFPIEENAINVFGIRSKDLTADKWNDTLGIITPGKKVIALSGTTDPGKAPLSRIEKINANGVFILQPGFYKNCWHKGKHKGKYNALVQFGSGIFKGWRDNNKDGKLDLTGKIWSDVQGLNFHTTRWDLKVQRVGDFSEGCQVVEVAQEYDTIINVIYASEQPLYSYALFQND